MKKLIVLVLVCMLVMTSCSPYGDYTLEDCVSAQTQIAGSKFDRLDSQEIFYVLNNNFPPDSIGDVLQTCINGGWEGYTR